MSAFSHAEIDYLGSQRLGRLATVGEDGVPHVVPVAFRYNPDADTIDIGGHDFAKRKKFRDVKRTGVAALVVECPQIRLGERVAVHCTATATATAVCLGPGSHLRVRRDRRPVDEEPTDHLGG